MSKGLAWGSPTAARDVMLSGRKKGELQTRAGSTYVVYQYEDFLVQIHKDDGEVILVMQKGQIIWVHPRDEKKLREINEVTNQRQPSSAAYHANQARKVQEELKNRGRK